MRAQLFPESRERQMPVPGPVEPEVKPLASGSEWSHMHAMSCDEFSGFIAMSVQPTVCPVFDFVSLGVSERIHVCPPSTERNTPRPESDVVDGPGIATNKRL